MKILTVDEAAEFLRIKPYTLLEMVRKNKLPGAKLGGEWRFTDESLEQHMRDLVSPKKTEPIAADPAPAEPEKKVPYRRQPRTPPPILPLGAVRK